MVSPHDPAVEVSPEGQTESPEMARAKQLAATIETLEQALEPKPRSISGKRASEKLADSRRLLESRIESIPDFERHSRKCQVCHSRWVEEIEEAYFNWSSAQWIINSFNISYDDAVYRHARALGLDIKRRENVVIALEKLIEKVDEVTVTSSTVIRAVRALSCLDSNGRWSDLPTTHVVVTTKSSPADMNTTGVLRGDVASTSAEAAPQRAEASPGTAAPPTKSAACPERSRRERSETYPERCTELPKEAPTSSRGSSSSRHASPPQEQNVLSSTEPSEGAPCQGTHCKRAPLLE